MNCFQKFISLIFETTFIQRNIRRWSCELLSKVYIFDIRDNVFSKCFKATWVVNCFQKFISLIFETTADSAEPKSIQLWIAFKSLYLWYSRQLTSTYYKLFNRCELLSKVYIFDIRDNQSKAGAIQKTVVNCFQKFISLIFETTLNIIEGMREALWIAFKSLYLWYSRQHLFRDILSPTVVNCFQKFISLIFETTFCLRNAWASGCELLSKVYIFDIRDNKESNPLLYPMLWIAFKSLYLWYSRQRCVACSISFDCCELLSKVYIFDIRDNPHTNDLYHVIVVNCFQKFISLIFETTSASSNAESWWLWIAFKSLYLWYSRQQQVMGLDVQFSCELLSKVYIFDIRDNLQKKNIQTLCVVNCFQKFISLIFETTTNCF